MTDLVAAIIPVLEPVRKDAIACNGGYASDDDDLAAGVVNIARAAGWTDDQIVENPAGAVSEFREICSFRTEMDEFNADDGPIHGYDY